MATSARGMFMGNRGILHDEQQRIVRDRATGSWIICLTEYEGRRREPMAPGRYTELFFLDEATALAAGHRPCFTCRRSEARRFLQLFRRLRGESSLKDLDRALARDRRLPRSASGTGKRAYQARVGDLPDGAMIEVGGAPQLVTDGGLRPWSHEGYGRRIDLDPKTTGWVLTPRTTVGVLAAGYRPAIHPSAATP